MRMHSEEESLYLHARNEIHDIVLNKLEEQLNGREDIIIMADESAAEILKLFGITEPLSLRNRQKGT